ncbi:MAG: FeoA family protein [Methermicoccaceae archaeon]
MPLIMVPEGSECTIRGINAGRKLSKRLAEMGFTENTRIQVLQSHGGPLIISLNGSRYTIGRGVAMKIMVE